MFSDWLMFYTQTQRVMEFFLGRNVSYTCTFLFLSIGNLRWPLPQDKVLKWENEERKNQNPEMLLHPKLYMNNHWMVPNKIVCVDLSPRWLPPQGKFNIYKFFRQKILIWTHNTVWQQTWLECALDGPSHNVYIYSIRANSLAPSPVKGKLDSVKIMTEFVCINIKYF